jgi:hypothetical protein
MRRALFLHFAGYSTGSHEGATMKRIVLGCLVAISTSAAAAGWVPLGATDDLAVYVDPASIQRKGNTVRMRALFDYKKPGKVSEGEYLSSKMEDEYDCANEQRRRLYLSAHSGQMGAGDTVLRNSRTGDWRLVLPDSMGETLWKAACDQPSSELTST